MGYSKNGVDITTLCEVAYGSSDTRNKASINTTNYLFNGNTRAVGFPNAQFISYESGYVYSTEALGGVYKKAGSNLALSAKGYRPGYTFRYSAGGSSGGHIKKFPEGDIWLGGTEGVRDGTRLCTQAENWNWLFACYAGGGGGGGGGSATASAGGGGGGGYIFAVFRLFAGRKMTFKAGWGGSAGGGNADGGNGLQSDVLLYANSSIPGANQNSFANAQAGYGGERGGSGAGGLAGGTYVINPQRSDFYVIQAKSGGNGASRNNAGAISTVNFNNHSPEAQQITYLTGSGGASGGSSGGGGGGGSPMGNGGAGGSGSGANGGSGSGWGAGGGGGAWKAFGTTNGGSGAPGYVAFYY
jgi:hypothetical protein